VAGYGPPFSLVGIASRKGRNQRREPLSGEMFIDPPYKMVASSRGAKYSFARKRALLFVRTIGAINISSLMGLKPSSDRGTQEAPNNL